MNCLRFVFVFYSFNNDNMPFFCFVEEICLKNLSHVKYNCYICERQGHIQLS